MNLWKNLPRKIFCRHSPTCEFLTIYLLNKRPRRVLMCAAQRLFNGPTDHSGRPRTPVTQHAVLPHTAPMDPARMYAAIDCSDVILTLEASGIDRPDSPVSQTASRHAAPAPPSRAGAQDAAGHHPRDTSTTYHTIPALRGGRGSQRSQTVWNPRQVRT